MISETNTYIPIPRIYYRILPLLCPFDIQPNCFWRSKKKKFSRCWQAELDQSRRREQHVTSTTKTQKWSFGLSRKPIMDVTWFKVPNEHQIHNKVVFEIRMMLQLKLRNFFNAITFEVFWGKQQNQFCCFSILRAEKYVKSLYDHATMQKKM